jgi:CheY-like chemotaxis protein
MVRVLIVDDDEDDRDLLSEAVHEIDPRINCILARNGQEALIGLRMHEMPKPNLIFLDLNMPRVNGIQFLKELRKDRALRDIPVAIYTTSNLNKDEQECRRLGAVHFVTKPSSFNGICMMVSKVFIDEMIIENRS